jgi:hypothetical protein
MTHNLVLKLEEYFKEEEISHEKLFNQITLYIYYLFSRESKSDIYILGKQLPNDQLKNLITYYNGDKINVPTIDEFREANILAICYFLKEIKGWSWEQIKKFFPSKEYKDFEFSSISFGKKINTIKESLKKDLMNSLKSIENLEEKKLKKLINKERKNKIGK